MSLVTSSGDQVRCEFIKAELWSENLLSWLVTHPSRLILDKALSQILESLVSMKKKY